MTVGRFCVLLLVVAIIANPFPVKGDIGMSTAKDATRILILGDSISSCNPLKGYHSWRAPLWRKLKNDTDVIRSGNYSADLARVSKQRNADGKNLSQCVSFEGRPTRLRSELFFPWMRGSSHPCAKAARDKAVEVPGGYDAWWGRYVANMAKHVSPRYSKAFREDPLDVVVVLAGINDFYWNENATVESVLLSFEKIVSDFLTVNGSQSNTSTAAARAIILGTVLPYTTKLGSRKQEPSRVNATLAKIERFNKMLASFAGKFPLTGSSTKSATHPVVPWAKFTLLDLREGYDPLTMTHDGIHPNREGEEFIANRLYPLIASEIRTRSRDCLGIPASTEPSKIPLTSLQETTGSKNFAPSQEASLSRAVQEESQALDAFVGYMAIAALLFALYCINSYLGRKFGI